MIDRTFVGKTYPRFDVPYAGEVFRRLRGLVAPDDSGGGDGYTLIWPKILLSHGTACLLSLCDDLAVDPRRMRLVRETFHSSRTPADGEHLTGMLTIVEIEQRASATGPIEDQVDMRVDFTDAQGCRVGSYEASYGLLVARMIG